MVIVMATFKDLEDSLKNFVIQEQSDAHNVRNINISKYNNIKLWMDLTKYTQPHVYIHLSISEAVFSIENFIKLNGGLGYEERIVLKWFNRMGIKEKLMDLWRSAEASRGKESESSIRDSDTV